MKNQTPRARVAVVNLGCKLNQAEGEAMRHRCAEAGFEIVPFESAADVYVVNTCTVTAEADRESRRLARRARRRGPADALVILAGCSPQANPEGMRIPEADLLLGNGEKLHLPEHLARPLGRERGALPEVRVAPLAESLPIETVALARFEGRTRAFLKVQDGCDFSCAFCATTLARGRSRSLAPEACAAQADRLAAGGHHEIVLTGVHLGAYGRDLDPPATLSRLVRRLIGREGLGRLRLSSVEPGEITRELVRVVSENAFGRKEGGGARVCRHFHIPVQSGDDGVLGAMGRNYRSAHCAGRFSDLARRIPGVCLGADLLVGFPGEDEAAFSRTMEWVREGPVSYLHVFPYSPREGTPASEREGRVPERALRARVGALQNLGRRKWAAFVTAQIGTEAEVLFERRTEEGFLEGLTDNYIRVAAEGPEEWIGRGVRLRLEPLPEKRRRAGAQSREEGLWGVEAK